MTLPRSVIGALVVGLSAALTGCIGAMQTAAHEPVGTGGLKSTQEDRDAGLVGISSGFDLKTFQLIAVDRFAVTEPELNDDEDKKLAAAMPAFFQSELVRHLRATGLFGKVVNLGETEFKPGSERALRLDGTITRLAPGSRALRYLVGFGAGRSKAQAEMRFVDVQSGQVVMVTADRRVAAYGVFGGDSEDHLKESFGDMARDLAKFLTRLARGEAPQGKD